MKPDARYMVGMILNKRGEENGKHTLRKWKAREPEIGGNGDESSGPAMRS